jgi:hypothetical protein
MRSYRHSRLSNMSSVSFLYNETENQVHLLTHVDLESAENLTGSLFEKYSSCSHTLSDQSIKNLILAARENSLNSSQIVT